MQTGNTNFDNILMSTTKNKQQSEDNVFKTIEIRNSLEAFENLADDSYNVKKKFVILKDKNKVNSEQAVKNVLKNNKKHYLTTCYGKMPKMNQLRTTNSY